MSDQLSIKKLEERKQLDLLISFCPEISTGQIIPTESPDFIIQRSPKRKTGIELTRLTRNGTGSYESENHFIPELTRESLVELIKSKEEKLPLYRKHKLRSIWLVIMVNGFYHSPAFNVHNQLAQWNIKSGFDAILIMDLSHTKVYVVKGNPVLNVGTGS